MKHDDLPEQTLLVADNQGNVVTIQSSIMPSGEIHMAMASNTGIEPVSIAAVLVNYARELVDDQELQSQLETVLTRLIQNNGVYVYNSSKRGAPPSDGHPF